MKLIRSFIYLIILVTFLSNLTCCSTAGKSPIIIKPKKDDIEKLRTAKTMRVVIDESYKYRKNITIPLYEISQKPLFQLMTQTFAEYAGLKTVWSNSEHCDMEFNIKSEAVAVPAQYKNLGSSYCKARIFGKVVLKIQTKPVYHISFKGNENDCPYSIPYAWPPSGAPFSKALLSSSFRQNIVKMMGDIYGLDWLSAALFDVDGFVRNEAAKELGATNNSMAVELLIDALNDDAPDYFRNNVVKVLGKVGGSRAMESLVNALNDDNPYFRRHVAKVLENTRDSHAVEPLLNFLTKNYPYKDGQTRFHTLKTILNVLGGIGDKRAVEPLIEFLQLENDRILQFHAAEALAKIGDYRAIKPIIDAMEGKDYSLFLYSSFGIEKCGDGFAGSLKKLTGKNIGLSHKEWLKWWEQNKRDYMKK